ncbi:septation protein SepH [Micrococcus sp.]|uniref:septation protein SepH n=1 Tax=Micrococcus sp. TaxID=1271 RepID=UPI002A9091A4|nr:septation protein SepH [Micrococcus sp.]MDY6055516.1 septation protein SepH [Micrococcus sp.]
MAELRLTGPTPGGDALRLAAPDGTEHDLPVTAYLRRLVLDPAAGESDDAGSPSESADTAGPAASPQAEAPESAPVTEASHTAPARASEGRRPSPVTPVTDQESVRAAASQEGEPLSPREIQARIRAGASVEQVARESGNPFSRIRTFGYPVLAERDWVAQQARGTEVWVGGPDLYSSTVADGGPTTLGELAAHRLEELGLDAGTLRWDAWRAGTGDWTVTAAFEVPEGHRVPTAEQPPATWHFRLGGGHLEPVDAWARVLSDAEAWDVLDSPAEADEEPAGRRSAAEDDGLLEILQARRGRRVGQDEASDDALAHLLARQAQQREAEEAAPASVTDAAGSGQEQPAERTEAERAAAPSRAARLLRGLPSLPPETAEQEQGQGQEQSQPAQPDQVQSARPEPTDESDADAGIEETTSGAEDSSGQAPEGSDRPGRPARPAMPTPTPRPRARTTGRRSSVPSWDEIVFGRKGD